MTATPPTRECTCGHVAHVHRGGGPCRVASGCKCPRFVEATRATAQDASWMQTGRRPRRTHSRLPHVGDE